MTVDPDLYQLATDMLPKDCPESIVTAMAESWQRRHSEALEDYEAYLDAHRTDEGDLGHLTISGASGR